MMLSASDCRTSIIEEAKRLTREQGSYQIIYDLLDMVEDNTARDYETLKEFKKQIVMCFAKNNEDIGFVLLNDFMDNYFKPTHYMVFCDLEKEEFLHEGGDYYEE